MARSYKAVLVSMFCALSLTMVSTVSDNHISRSSYSTCPTWQMHSKVNSSSTCECGPSLDGVVECNVYDNSVSLLPCYCMSQSKLLNKTIVGNCLYTCHRRYRITLSNTTSELDNQICKPLHRMGQLCGDCIPEYAPPVYSYSMECVKCTNNATNWLKYLAAAFIPLTVFYFIIVVFRISASSPKLRCFILVSQMVAMPGHLRYLYALLNKYIQDFRTERRLVEAALSLYSIWNLDFFRAVYHPFCIHPHISSLGILALDYLPAMYPLLLISITYCCIKLHDKFSVIRQLLKPFHRCCFHFRKEWNIHRSLTDAFATFILLSYVKILNISFDLLIPTTIYDMKGGNDVFSFLYYSGTVQVFKGEHTPFAILALFMMIVFNIIPLILLCLYPCPCFQKLVNSCKCHCQTLHVFMDIFHGCYRTKPVDCRYIPSVYLVIRIINLLIFSFTLSRFYYPFAAVLSLLAAVFVIVIQPYKLPIYNKLDTCLFLLFTCRYIPATAYALSPTDKLNKHFIIMIILAEIVQCSYIVSLVIYWAIPHRVKQQVKTSIKQIYCKEQQITPDEDFLETAHYYRELTESTTFIRDPTEEETIPNLNGHA